MIRYAVATAPLSSIIIPPLADVKDNLMLETTDVERDAYITSLIHAAREYCESFLGWRLAECTMYAYLDDFPEDGIIELIRGPVQSITAIAYKASGASTYTTMSVSNYELSNHQTEARILINTIPSVNTDKLDPVRITYVAGYDNPLTIPKPILHAIRLRVADLYLHPENSPENFGMGLRTTAADVLLRPYKHRRF